MTSDRFRETTSGLAREAGVTAATVATYADMGLLDHIRLPGSGMRLFRHGQAERVRAIYRERMASRGRRATLPAAT